MKTYNLHVGPLLVVGTMYMRTHLMACTRHPYLASLHWSRSTRGKERKWELICCVWIAQLTRNLSSSQFHFHQKFTNFPNSNKVSKWGGESLVFWLTSFFEAGCQNYRDMYAYLPTAQPVHMYFAADVLLITHEGIPKLAWSKYTATEYQSKYTRLGLEEVFMSIIKWFST